MVNKNFKTVQCEDIKFGLRFSAPVFFDDGENMFLAEGKAVKAYHIAALKRWKIPYLLTFGRILDPSVEPAKNENEFDDIDELEDLEEIEEV